MWSRKWTFLQQPSWLLLAIALCLYTKKVSFRVLGCHNLVKLYSKQLAEAARQLLSCYYIMHGKLSFSSLAFTCLEKKSFWVKSAFFLGNLALEGSLGSLFERRPAELQLWPQLCYQRQMGKENVILEKAWKKAIAACHQRKKSLLAKLERKYFLFPPDRPDNWGHKSLSQSYYKQLLGFLLLHRFLSLGHFWDRLRVFLHLYSEDTLNIMALFLSEKVHSALCVTVILKV